MINEFTNLIFNISNDDSFNDVAVKIFRYQYENNPVYARFADYLKIVPKAIDHYTQIPFLPIEFFKNHQIITGNFQPAGFFQSSGTTQSKFSRHYYSDLKIYETSFIKNFELAYGSVSEYCLLALLPSYLEQQNSSLVYMAQKLITLSGNPVSGFYLNNYDELHKTLTELEKRKQKTLLLGVTYALLDFIEIYPMDLKHTIVMETGGMKGRRREMVREELHEMLCRGFGVNEIHSEYGMTELFSQAYSKGVGIFRCPPQMRVLIRDVNDPPAYETAGKTGGINVIDLANLSSCAFIATQDLGRVYGNGSFEVLGRFDYADVRGCNLMVS
jgi:phenylacetate-coenzyme A ligase PaaK-like adenylate-forming protein